MQTLVLFTALTFAALKLQTFIYAMSQTLLGRWLGIRVVRVTIGLDLFGKYMTVWQGRHWEWRIGLLPFGSSTKFKSADDFNEDEFYYEEDGRLTPLSALTIPCVAGSRT